MHYILIGPDLHPYTGQSIAFHNLANSFKYGVIVMTYGGSGLTKCYRSIVLIFKFLLLAIIRKNSVQCIYITTSRSQLGSIRDIVILFIAGLLGLRLVNHLHGADFISFRSSLGRKYRKLLDIAYGYFDTSIVLLPSMVEQYAIYKNMEVKVVSNGVEDLYDPKIEKKSKHISYLSNIMYTKGIIHLIDAVVELNEIHRASFTLNIAGEFMGDSEMSSSEVRDLFFKKISGYDYIVYSGVVFGEKKASFLNESEYFVLPTFYKTEAQPLAIMEAMMCRNVILSTKHNYISDVVTDAEGRLIKPRDVGELVKALLELAESNEVKQNIMENNRKKANEKYSLNTFVTQTKNIIQGEKN